MIYLKVWVLIAFQQLTTTSVITRRRKIRKEDRKRFPIENFTTFLQFTILTNHLASESHIHSINNISASTGTWVFISFILNIIFSCKASCQTDSLSNKKRERQHHHQHKFLIYIIF